MPQIICGSKGVNRSSYPSPRKENTEKELEQLKVFAVLIGRRLTVGQLASAWEEWELVCEQRGWPPPPDV